MEHGWYRIRMPLAYGFSLVFFLTGISNGFPNARRCTIGIGIDKVCTSFQCEPNYPFRYHRLDDFLSSSSSILPCDYNRLLAHTPSVLICEETSVKSDITSADTEAHHTWYEMYERLISYKKQFNSTLVPQKHESDRKLWNWVNQQRSLYKQKSLSLDRELKLNELGFVWSCRPKWEDMFRLLKQYKEREGHCNIPISHKEDGRNLGTWLNTQRQCKKKGKLESGKQLELEELGIAWDLLSGKWEMMYTILKQYKDREGHCNVPYMHQEDGQNLGSWLKKQRLIKKNGKLDPLREKRLEEIGVLWRIRKVRTRSTWDDMFALLVQYQQLHGNCNVRQSYRVNEENLGMWLTIQRHAKRTGKLSAKREEQLARLGISWDRVNAWDEMYVLLEKYKEREGHCDVSHRHKEDGRNLGYWLRNQRQAKQTGKLDPYKVEKMEKIGVAWRMRKARTTTTWEDMFSLLEHYHTTNGHCNVPYKYLQDGENLGKWLTRQRHLKRNKTLNPKREERLAKLGVVWETRSDRRRKA